MYITDISSQAMAYHYVYSVSCHKEDFNFNAGDFFPFFDVKCMFLI